MANENRRLLLAAALCVPIILAAEGARMAVNSAQLRVYPSASVLTAAELDSLRGYVVRTSALAPAAAPVVGGFAMGSSDPFSGVSREEGSRYLTTLDQTGSARRDPARWIVSTIMITETRRVAVVNGVLASAGSLLPGGARVLSIEPDHVVIAEPGGVRREVSVQGGAN